MLKPEDLIGTWEMVEYYLEKDGKRVYPLGTGCKGYLMYTPDGYVPETGDVTVRHSMNVSMNPTWLGQSQERNAHVEDGILTIHAPVNGAHLVWRKVTNKE